MNRIKEILKEKGYSQKELAEVIGKSVVSVSKYANGEITIEDFKALV